MSAINTRAAHDAGIVRMAELSAQLQGLQGQIATGRRVSAPKDDPVAFSRAAVLRRADAASDATQRGIDAAARRLSATDVALESISNLVVRARELALQGSNSTFNPEDRAILATEVRELAASFSGLADSRGSDGERLFGGAAASGPAYGLDANGIMVWQGAGRAPAVAAGGALVASGIEGPDAFGTTTAPTLANPQGTADLFASFSQLAEALEQPDAALRATALATSLGQLDGHVTRLADARALAGARGARLEAEGERLAKAGLATATELSKLEDLEMTEGIARLQRLLTVLEAAQASFVRTSNLSLWDQL